MRVPINMLIIFIDIQSTSNTSISDYSSVFCSFYYREIRKWIIFNSVLFNNEK